MTPDQENALVSKVNAIHDAIVGPLGIEEDGLLFRVRDHGKRITSLERWRWLILGGAGLLVFLAELWAKAGK